MEATSRVREDGLSESPAYVAARARVEALQSSGSLDERALASFAAANQFVEAALALARLCDLPVEFVERSLAQERSETVLILARAAALSWPTVKMLLVLRGGKRAASASELAAWRPAVRNKSKSSQSSARRYSGAASKTMPTSRSW